MQRKGISGKPKAIVARVMPVVTITNGKPEVALTRVIPGAVLIHP